MQILEIIANHKFGGVSNIGKFLDFASGHGRLTRFVVQVLDANRVWISDIKPGAVDYQKTQFGVHGFVSTSLPEDILVDQAFDCIFVGSLFSHLTNETFARWL